MKGLASVQATVDSSAVVVLAELLDAGAVGIEADDLFDLIRGRLLAGLVDVLAAALDAGGPEEVIACDEAPEPVRVGVAGAGPQVFVFALAACMRRALSASSGGRRRRGRVPRHDACPGVPCAAGRGRTRVEGR